MKYIKRFILMLQFLTSIPLPVNVDAKEEDFGKGLVFAPAVGMIIGGILAGGYLLLSQLFPGYLAAVFIIVLYIILTGGLHLDGLGDTFDGLFSNRSRERILEIMRDSRVGTNAVLAIVCVLALNIAAISSFKAESLLPVLVLLPAAGRIGSLVGAGMSKYARSGEGLGKSFIDWCGRKEIAAGLIIALILFYAVLGWKGAVLWVFSSTSAATLTELLTRKLGGATGDILGAVCELNQTAFLIFVLLLQGVAVW